MTSTLQRKTSQAPRPPSGSFSSMSDHGNGSAHRPWSETSSDDLNGEMPPTFELTLYLPDGTHKQVTVDSSKQMMDLSIQLAASHKFSPAGHTLHVYHGETGKNVEYHASQTIGSLCMAGVSQLYLVSKKSKVAEIKERKPSTGQQPFEKTQRLTLNLPRNQKMVTRVNYKMTLAEIFKMVCNEKHLDPYKYELRHPTRPDEALNMATPLEDYGIHDIYVVSVLSTDAHTSSSDHPLETSASHLQASTMPRRKAEPETGANYMPGMEGESKKKKGLMRLFSRKKGASFKPQEAAYSTGTVSSRSSVHSVTHSQSMPQVSVTPVTAAVPPRSSSPSDGSSVPESHIEGASAGPSTLPRKPPRKKRPAPPPPPVPVAPSATKPLEVNVAQNSHSRTSSHSSGFDESNVSPLESPGNSSRESTKTAKTKTSLDATSIESGEASHSRNIAHSIESTQVPNEQSIKASETISLEVAPPGVENTGTIQKGTYSRKKRKAPAPPPPPPVVALEQSLSHSASTSPVSSPVDSSPPEGATLQEEEFNTQPHESAVIPPPPPSFEDDHHTDIPEDEKVSPPEDSTENPEILKAALISELKQGVDTVPEGLSPRPRPAQFIAPPPPTSPPPPETPTPYGDRVFSYDSGSSVTVADSAVQVHVSERDSLRSDGEDQPESVALGRYLTAAEIHRNCIKLALDTGLIKDRSLLEIIGSAVSDVSLEDVNDAFDQALAVDVSPQGSQRDSAIDEQIEAVGGSTDNMERERKNSEDSDVSSSGSSVMQYDVNILDDKDEIALPESSVVLVKQTSFTGEEKDTVSSGGHVTVVNINAEGTTEQTSDSGRSSADTPEVGESKTGHFDPQQAMAATDEISFDQEEIQYVSPSQPAMATTDDQAADSFYDPDGSPKDEEEEEEEGFDLNDYRIAHLVKEELVDFQYGGGIKKLERKDKKKEEEKPSVMSLRQAYRRPYRTAEEPFQSVPLKDAVRGESTDSQPDIPTLETGTLYSMHTNEEVTEPEEDKEEFKPVEEITMETDKAWEAIENTKPSYTSSSVHTGILRTIETPGDSSISLETQSFTDNESTRSLSPSARLSLSYEEDQVSSPPHTPTYFPRDELEKSHIKTQSLMERKSSFESEENKSNVMPVSPPREKPSSILRSERPLSYQEKNERRLSDETIEKNNNQSEKTISSSLMGPRPFGMYRAKSEPSVQQISVASDDVPNIELTPVAEDNKVRKEARRLSALVGPQGYVRQGYSKIGFMPRSEGENENVLEEKSISMMALSPNRQSADSSVDMNGHSPATSTPMREDNGEAQPKKSLQKQYEDLQKQFSNWQQQLMENQALLSKKKLSPRSTSPVSPISPSRAPSKFSFEASALPPPAPAPPSVNRQPIKKSWSVEPKATAAKPDAKYVRPKSNNPYTLGGGTSGRFSSSDLMSGKAQLRKGSSGYSTEFSSVDSGADIPPLPLSPPPSAPPVMQSTNKNIPREGSPTSLKRSLSSDPPPAPKPPPVQKVAAPSKSGAPRGKSRFEPKLDPREELMIAIRSAGGRQALNKVPVNKTKWYYTGPSRSALKS